MVRHRAALANDPILESPPRRGAVYHPAFAGAARYAIEERPSESDDEANTAQTIARMAQYIREDAVSPIIRQAAHAAAGSARDPRAEAEAVHAWIRAHVRYQPDEEIAAEMNGARPIVRRPNFAEVLIRPVDLLTMPAPAGDCDDFAMLTAAMLRALGVDSELVTVAADAADPESYSHVYVMAKLDGGASLALDSSHGPYPGWEVAPAGKRRTWTLEDKHMIRTRTLGSFDWGDLASQGLDITGEIMKARYAVPQLEPGVTIRQPDGTILQQLPAGTTAAVQGAATTGMTLLIVAGVALAVLFAVSSRRS
jgi:hypothetical protein